MTRDILGMAREWTAPQFDEATRREVGALIEKNDLKELRDRFALDLEFGTGGMRGIMAPGTNRMNVYTVGRATQGLANHLLETYPDARGRGVAIAFDSRNNSDLFAREAASVLAGNGVKAFIFPELRPTPLLSFAVRELGCRAGIVVTASHNPKEYNGYKVYGPSGSQVVSPEDARIVDHVGRVRVVRDVKKAAYAEGVGRGLIVELGPETERAYLERVHGLASAVLAGIGEGRGEGTGDVKVVYTPLHGAGITLVPKALGRIPGVSVVLEEAQSVPDGNFPTTASPNPEEGAALARAIAAARERGADMVIATDPDCDRMGLAVREGTGDFALLTGNQIGCLLEHLVLRSLQRTGGMPPDPVVITTIVSTGLAHEIGRGFGVKVVDVLTGFKYFGERIAEFERTGGGSFVFGFEESYGYLADTFVRDKDGVVASVLAVLLLKHAAASSVSVTGLLEELYRAHGVFAEYGKSFTLKGIEGSEKIKSLMVSLRARPPERIGEGRVTLVQDYLERTARELPGGRANPMEGLPKSDVLQFATDNGVKVSVRPSGTEPKIKFYFALKAPLKGSLAETRRLLDGRYERASRGLFSALGLG